MKAFITYPIVADYIYIADTAHLPYGLKPYEYINDRMIKLTNYLLDTHHIDILVIACNTATAISATLLRELYPTLPIIGIEPAIKPAAHASKTQNIAIVATTSMLNNRRLQRLIDEFAPTLTVTKIPADSWVTLVEAGIFSGEQARRAIQSTLQPLNNQPIDQLILGCTHFPFLDTELRATLPNTINLVNPASAVAKHAKNILQFKQISTSTDCSFHYFTTGNATEFTHQIHQLHMPTGTVATLDV